MRKLHPATAAFRALNGASAGLGIGLVAALGLGAVLGGGPDLGNAILIVVVAGLAAIIGAGFGVLQYLRFEYDVADETVSIAHGVLARTERDIPFRRIQNVDIRRGIVERIIGVATVNLETAGGGSTEAVLKVVDLAEAERIQDVVAGFDQRAEATASDVAETDDRAHPERPADATSIDQREDAGSGAGEVAADTQTRSSERPAGRSKETLFELSTEDLAIMSAVSFDPSGLAVLIFTLPFGQEFAFEILSQTVATLGGPALPSLEAISGLSTLQLGFVLFVGALQFALAAWAASAVITAVKYYDFRLTKVGEDLRYERGLLQRYTGTIPLEKIQAVTVRENAAMRRVGMAALDLETAGYGPSRDGKASNTAIPLDDRTVVVTLAERLGDVSYPSVERPPRRARRRYAVRYSILPIVLTIALFAANALVYSFPRWWIPLPALLLAPIAGHYTWKHRGHATTDRAFVARSSFWRRHTRIVPYYRIQTVIDERSVFQRWRNLASVTADTASTASIIGGDATAHDVEEETAVGLHRTLRGRLAADLGRRRAERGSAESDDVSASTDDPINESEE